MGVQLAQSELDNMQQWQTAGKTPVEIHQRLAASRRRRSKSEPDLTTVRRALEGTTFKRSRVETRGRKKVLSPQNLKVLDRVRVRLVANVDSEREPSPRRHPAMGSPNFTATISSITTTTFISIATVTDVASCHWYHCC